jgi:NAD(P)-dependent dehydrogenase (short-subunit alcohol dehydrogenase family)
MPEPRNQYAFDGRVALITGGASGIGQATAKRLHGFGARVAVFDRGASDDEHVALSLTGDVARSADVDAAVERVERELGRLDVLICCAGITGELCPPLELSDEEFSRVLAINTGGVFYSMRAAIPAMVGRGYGRVVNMASISAKEGLPEADAYAASKAAVVSLTRTVGRSVAGTGVLVNCVAPTVIATPMISALSDEYKAGALAKIPLGRFGEPDELATFIAFLASDDLTYSTGTCFDFSGGRANF